MLSPWLFADHVRTWHGSLLSASMRWWMLWDAPTYSCYSRKGRPWNIRYSNTSLIHRTSFNQKSYAITWHIISEKSWGLWKSLGFHRQTAYWSGPLWFPTMLLCLVYHLRECQHPGGNWWLTVWGMLYGSASKIVEASDFKWPLGGLCVIAKRHTFPTI